MTRLAGAGLSSAAGLGRRSHGAGTRLAPAIAVATWAAVAWIALLSLADMSRAGHDVGSVVAFQAAWVVMMAAMMLPSILPFVVLLRRTATPRRVGTTTLVATAYLGVWSATGAVAYAVAVAVEPSTVLVAALLTGAGAYQFTPLKAWCLRRCRSPVAFLLEHWRSSGRFAGLRLGALHGAHCVGCCWALMLVLVGALGMQVGWVAVLAGVVVLEKALPVGERISRVTGALLIAAAVAVLIAPETLGVENPAPGIHPSSMT